MQIDNPYFVHKIERAKTRGIKNCRYGRLFKGCSPLQLLCNWIGNHPQSATFHTANFSGNIYSDNFSFAQMQKVKLIVENTFANLSSNNKEIGISVFDRVFNKLITGAGPLGKVHPIYLKFGNYIKTIGVLTLNTSGSYSFFPELPGQPEFDHMTFNKNITKDKHHYTRLTDNGREKVLPITAEHLTNDTYHVASIIVQDHSYRISTAANSMFAQWWFDIKVLSIFI